jgi:uncharacterized integral membrane protein
VSGERSDFEGLTGAPTSAVGESPRRHPDKRRDRRVIAAGAIGALITAFALLNLDDVKVHWLVTSGQTPLIIVIAFAFILGMLVDRLVIRAQKKRRREPVRARRGTEQ